MYSGTRRKAAWRITKTLHAKECGEGSNFGAENSSGSLAVFYVEQVALNRHVSCNCNITALFITYLSMLVKRFFVFRHIPKGFLPPAGRGEIDGQGTLRALAGDRLFDLSALALPASEDEAAQEVVALLQSLRIPPVR